MQWKLGDLEFTFDHGPSELTLVEGAMVMSGIRWAEHVRTTASVVEVVIRFCLPPGSGQTCSMNDVAVAMELLTHAFFGHIGTQNLSVTELTDQRTIEARIRVPKQWWR